MTSPALLLAVHGTRSAAGQQTTAGLVRALLTERPRLSVTVGFLDVIRPSLRDELDRLRPPVIVVPWLLSAGFHVRRDIPDAVTGRSEVRVTPHLGPAPAVIEALADRLVAAAGSIRPATTLLARVGSSRTEAAMEFDAARALLSTRLGRPVQAAPPAAALRAELGRFTPPIQIAPYLLAEGEFYDGLRRDAEGRAVVAEPIGVHPAVVALVLARYDAAT